MKQRILLLLKYYLFWILFFVIQKPAFMLWQCRSLGEVQFTDWFLVMWHGLPLDLSVAAYIVMAAGLFLIISVWWQPMQRAIDYLTGIALFVTLWVFIGDNGCFPYWGYHLDSNALLIFTSPKEAFANAEWWVWLLGVVGFIVLFVVWWLLYKHTLQKRLASLTQDKGIVKKIGQTGVMLLLTASLFLPLRGSVTVSTMNTGRVYFSDNAMLNMAAVNPLFNLIETLSSPAFDTGKYTYMSSKEAESFVNELLEPATTDSLSELALLSTTRPNIILFILESFSANAWDVMPCLRQLASEGILFNNAYASSYRTDRGVVATLSGFPGQPTSSLMLYPHKTQRLPHLGQDLKKEGYALKFWYGGDEDFTSMRSYLVNGGFEDRVSDKDFPLSDRMSKWGVPDHILFSRAAHEIAHRTSQQPRLDVILSLSSHEPFDVPMHRHTHPYLNAVAYTDSCLGAFVDTLKTSLLWDSTLVVMVADHGYPYPEGISRHDTLRYKIPVVITGGAVRQLQVVHTLCSQIDLVPTLLAMLQLDHSAYLFGKNILDQRQTPFAFYSFNDGFALLTESGATVMDAAVNKPVLERNPDPYREQQARAFIQRIMETIDN